MILDHSTQQEPLFGKSQRRNAAGGYSHEIDRWARLVRFLILGTEGGTFYTSGKALSIENANVALQCIRENGPRVVRTILEVERRAPKVGPSLMVLALAAKRGDDETRHAALAAVPMLCRTGTQLFEFAAWIDTLGGWGRGTRRAFMRWYREMPIERLVYQVLKYPSRAGWTHRDILRLAHAKTRDPLRNRVYRYAARGEAVDHRAAPRDATAQLWAVLRARSATSADEIVELIEDFGLVREMIPTAWLGDTSVWGALFERMPLGAMVRNLSTMTRVGLLRSTSACTDRVIGRLEDREQLKKARLHPVQLLTAAMAYRAGRGTRGQTTWTPVTRIVRALELAFKRSFDVVEPTGCRYLVGLDVSASMDGGTVAGVPGLTPRIASAAQALVLTGVEKHVEIVAFTRSGYVHPSSKAAGWPSGLSEVLLTPRMSLDEVVKRVSSLPMGGTDCALPILYAEATKREVDVFVVLTDNETWAGNIHPSEALVRYREASGIAAKLVVVGMTATEFSIADPSDGKMMDVVGFDAAACALIADFARGSLT